MKLALCLALSLMWGTAAPGEAQEGSGSEQGQAETKIVRLRISSLAPDGLVVVDRGESDGLAVGDQVRFQVRGAGVLDGVVIEVAARSAVVDMTDRNQLPPAGTRGMVRIPKSRIPERVQRPRPQQQEAPTSQLPWENKDEKYTQDMPLLAQVEPVRPEQRAPSVTGRYNLFGDYTGTTVDRSDAFLRAGIDTVYDNPFARGGAVHFDGEINYRRTDLPDARDENETILRIDRLSYARGGTRFEPDRWEAGRFLQTGMPEFGVVDGFEWSRRLQNGHRYGASIGWMPEPDPDFESGHDFQVAAYYRWVADRREHLAVDTGYQKTFHNGNADRDLFVTRVEFLPLEGWNFNGTAWIDFYTSGDDAKGSGLGLTRLLATASRRWENGNGVVATYAHREFPELDRNEFLPVEDDQLADDRNDSLSVRGWRWVEKDRRLHGQAGLFLDEDEFGGNLEFGMDLRDWWLDESRADVTLYVTEGEFSSVYGGYLSYGRALEIGRWDVFYEFGFHDNAGFTEERDDVVQHRLRGTRLFVLPSGWNISAFVEGQLWDDEGAWSLGFYAQKSF